MVVSGVSLYKPDSAVDQGEKQAGVFVYQIPIGHVITIQQSASFTPENAESGKTVLKRLSPKL